MMREGEKEKKEKGGKRVKMMREGEKEKEEKGGREEKRKRGTERKEIRMGSRGRKRREKEKKEINVKFFNFLFLLALLFTLIDCLISIFVHTRWHDNIDCPHIQDAHITTAELNLRP